MNPPDNDIHDSRCAANHDYASCSALLMNLHAVVVYTVVAVTSTKVWFWTRNSLSIIEVCIILTLVDWAFLEAVNWVCGTWSPDDVSAKEEDILVGTAVDNVDWLPHYENTNIISEEKTYIARIRQKGSTTWGFFMKPNGCRIQLHKIIARSLHKISHVYVHVHT